MRARAFDRRRISRLRRSELSAARRRDAAQALGTTEDAAPCRSARGDMSARFDRAAAKQKFREPNAPPVLATSMQRSLDHKRAAQAGVPWEALRDRAHALKADAIANLDVLLEQFER